VSFVVGRKGEALLNRDNWKPIVFPAGAVFMVSALLLHSEMLAISAGAIASAYYAVFLAGLLLAARFRSTRVFFSLIVLMLAHRAVEFFAEGTTLLGPGRTAFEYLSFLVPLNLVAFTRMKERGWKVPALMPRLAIILLQAVVVTLACRPSIPDSPGILGVAIFGRTAFHWARIPHLAIVTLLSAATYFGVRFVRSGKPIETGFLWTLVAVFLSFHYGGIGRLADGYMAIAGLILVASVVETSYVMAYHDELTTLPGRRAFNETLASFDGPYAIAIVDIDHFKNFNDTYGHDTGDEVLRMVASRLARVTGGGKAFRCGGEEFAILFEGRSAKDAVDDLELLRRVIESSRFRVRGQTERRRLPRQDEQDRRKPVPRTPRAQSGFGVTQAVADLSVTVSIGVAEPSTRLREVDQVIQAADKALYRAKANGRNRVELASAARVRAIRAKKASA
jgi:diguanylate cyclase (GGDEF)-like protein